MLQKLVGIASTLVMVAFSVPDYYTLHYVGPSLFFFGEPEYPSDVE